MRYLSVTLLIVSCTVVLGVSLAGFQSWPAAIVALAAIANFAFEQWLADKNDELDKHLNLISDLARDIERIESKILALTAHNVDVYKQAEEVKKIVQHYNLKQMFGPKV